MKSLFLLISSPFFYTFVIKYGNIQGLNKVDMKADVASRRVEAKMEERDVWSQGGQVTNLDLLETSKSTWSTKYGQWP